MAKGYPGSHTVTTKVKAALVAGVPIINDITFGQVLSGQLNLRDVLSGHAGNATGVAESPARNRRGTKATRAQATKKANALIREQVKEQAKGQYPVGF